MNKPVLILLSLAVVSVSQAAVLTVTNTADDGTPGCLRECVARAQPGDEIRFDPSLDGQPIVLSGDELVIDKSLTIAGRGPDATILDGNHRSRVLRLEPGTTVTISGVMVKGGSAERGAGIYNWDGDLEIENCTIRGNSASQAGGGVYSYRGTLTITDSTVSANTSEFGGGIYSGDSDLTVTGSIISGNAAIGQSGSAGGGVLGLIRGSITIRHSTISDNSAAGSGGGIDGHGLLISHSTIRGNATGWYGAGIHGCFDLISHSTISDNSAEQAGGGVFCRLGAPMPYPLIANTTISGNSARRGGGVHLTSETSGAVTILNSTITGNAAEHGGGISTASWEVFGVGNSVIANQAAGEDCDLGPEGYFSFGHNLGSDGTCVPAHSTDRPETDPELGPLQDNGGPTWTHAPLQGSPAIDSGWCDPGTDQRGVPRPLDGNRDGVAICDIGAVEHIPYQFTVVGPGGDVIVIPPDGE